jgi:hypothetical protein
MKKKIFKVLGVAILFVFTLASCKKETTTPTNPSNGNTTDTTNNNSGNTKDTTNNNSGNTNDTTKNILGVSSFNIKVNTTTYEFTGDHTGKDSTMGAMVLKNKKTGKFQIAFVYQKINANSDTAMFSLIAQLPTLSNTKFTASSNDTLIVMTALSGKNGFMYFQESVDLNFTSTYNSPSVGTIISGSIDGQIGGIDFINFSQVSHPISGNFKAVYIGEFDSGTLQNPVALKKILSSNVINKYNRLLKAQND